MTDEDDKRQARQAATAELDVTAGEIVVDGRGGVDAQVVDPDAPVRFVRLIVDGDERALLPWDEAAAVAAAVAEYEEEGQR